MLKNRWTLGEQNTDNDWASILFGNSGDLTKRFVNNLSVDFYTDGAIGLPKEYVVEYYVGKEILIYQVMSVMRNEIAIIHLIIQKIGKQLKIYMLQVSYLQLKQITSHLTR